MNFLRQIPCLHGSVLLGQRCNMLCTSGFMDDVKLGRNGPYGNAWTGAESDVYECLVLFIESMGAESGVEADCGRVRRKIQTF